MPIYCITGTNRGLGLEFVRQLAGSAANTVIATTRPGADRGDLDALAAAASTAARIVVLDCDTASVPSIHIFAQKVRRNVLAADEKIDVLVNNAGVNGTPEDQTSLSLDPGLLAAQVSVNVLGPAKVVEFLSDNKVLATGVRIINMSSSMGSVALSGAREPRRGASYSMSKAALNMLTVHQAYDVRQRAQTAQAVVVAMDPGWVRTRMGGAEAPLEQTGSVAGMLAVVGGLGEADNGGFFEHSGKKHPW